MRHSFVGKESPPSPSNPCQLHPSFVMNEAFPTRSTHETSPTQHNHVWVQAETTLNITIDQLTARFLICYSWLDHDSLYTVMCFWPDMPLTDYSHTGHRLLCFLLLLFKIECGGVSTDPPPLHADDTATSGEVHM